MRSEKNKIKTIVNELLTNSIRANANDIDINVSLSEDEITIIATDDGDGMDEKQLQKARESLNQPYRKDLEEQFGQLAGMDVSSGGGLNIIGMQIKSAEVDSTKGEGTKIVLKKERNKR